jgi:hypothetical protein
MDGKDAVYLMDKSNAGYFMKTLNDLVTLDTLPKIDSNAEHELRFTGPDGKTMDFVNLENGSGTYYTDAQNWFLKAEDGSLTPVYDASITGILGEITDIKYDSCLTSRASGPELDLLRLTDPLYTISLDYTAPIRKTPKRARPRFLYQGRVLYHLPRRPVRRRQDLRPHRRFRHGRPGEHGFRHRHAAAVGLRPVPAERLPAEAR